MKYLSIKNRGTELTIGVTLRPTNHILQDGVNVPQLFDDIIKLISEKTTPNTRDESVKPPIQILSQPPKTDGIFKATNSGDSNGTGTGKEPTDGKDGKDGAFGKKDFSEKVAQPLNTTPTTDTRGTLNDKTVTGNSGDIIKKSDSSQKTFGTTDQKEMKEMKDKGRFEKLEKPTAGMTVEAFKQKWSFDDDDFNDWLKFEYPKLTESEKSNLTDISWKPFLGAQTNGKN